MTTVAELARVSSQVKWVTRRVARASRGQVEVVWANASGYLLATNSASGKLYTTRGTTSGRVHRCTLKGRRCSTWG